MATERQDTPLPSSPGAAPLREGTFWQVEVTQSPRWAWKAGCHPDSCLGVMKTQAALDHRCRAGTDSAHNRPLSGLLLHQHSIPGVRMNYPSSLLLGHVF